MIIDTIRNGKSVSIEIKDKRVVGASVDVEQAKQPKITKAMRKSVSLNGKPIGRWLNFAIMFVSAMRKEHADDPMITRPLSCQEMAEIYSVILEDLGFRSCSKQNISRIDLVAQRKLRRNGKLRQCCEELTGRKINDDSYDSTSA